MGFIVLPFMLFNSRKRVQTQISRISQYSRKLISSRRIDDNDSIRKNISNLIQEIKDNISKSNKAKKISIKYGEKVLLVHATTGLFMSVEPRVRERLTLGQWRQTFKPFRLTATTTPNVNCLFEFVPVDSHRHGHSIKLDQPCRLAYIHERPVEKQFVMEAECNTSQAIMIAEEPKGSIRMTSPFLPANFPAWLAPMHGAAVLIFNK